MRLPVSSAVLLVLILTQALVFPAATAIEIHSGYTVPPPESAAKVSPQEIPFWELPLSILFFVIVFLPAECLAFVKFLLPLRFREISSRNVLEQDARARIYDTIRENPGIHLRGISRKVGIGMGTVRYHVTMLLRTHKITDQKESGSTHFFENSGKYSRQEQLVHHHLRNPTTQKLIREIRENPDAGRNHLAQVAGISGSSVTWYIRRLESDGIVRSVKSGRTVTYTIPEEIQQILHKGVCATTEGSRAPSQAEGFTPE